MCLMNAQNFDLEQVLINFSGQDGNTPFTIRDAVEGISVMGSNGSGKSSGSARLFAHKYLANGFGGLILTVKNDEKETWLSYLRQTQRMDDLILVEPGGKYHFNFLAYEAAHKAGGQAISENLAQVIETVIDSNEEKNRGQASDPFWQDSLHMLVVNVLDLCMLAYDKVSVRSLYNIALTVPKGGQDTEDKPKLHSFGHAFQTAKEKVKKQAKEFVKTLSEAEKEKLTDDDYYDRLVIENIPDAALFRSLDQFFNDHYKNLAIKTRGIVEFSLVGLLFRLLREPIYSLFCRHESNFTPEDCYLTGKVILINLPTKVYHKAGRDIQVAFKYIWQRVMERRNITENARPVFLFADEAQEFLHPHDVSYQATARSSRICTVYITQNLSSYHANMGGLKSEHKVNAFLGTLGTKIFHSNSDVQTNMYASDLIGSAYVEDESRGTTVAGDLSVTRNTSYRLEKMMRPEEFTNLKTGGPRNDFLVEGIVHRQNNPFYDGLSFRKITFKQV
jgi:type IV secretory pathway TraG/TraD family ATPase VirD4